MVKPIHYALGAIPVIVALLISVPLITKNEIPISAANSFDYLEIEYTKHQLKKISNSYIKNDGTLKYSVTELGYLQPDIRSKLDEKKLNKIRALIKETGFIAIPSESFSIIESVTEYQKSNVKVTLNGEVNQIYWPEQNATSQFIPPIITMVEYELDQIISKISE
jgi:hypothetical protein